MEPSDTSQYSEIQEVSQQNGLLMTESYTEGNLWMSFNDQCINLMVRSSVNANDALVKDGTDEEDGALRMQPSMSNVQFKAHALKPNATNIMRQKRSNRGRTNQESVKFLVTDSTAKISDGYLWLKFGQKNIKNNLHPRYSSSS
ncbi:hypothetical protein KP509_24G032300 [Ceratopteris richardii]|uniref:WRKY domain-containing protein n=1 Tax=Ceratopteris richardii TaxID=49495 RepID=A0A8T2RWJ1_CERRI|nr:hypothetical protein KP509_24G032300 [Ceratopteris richardii]